MGISGQKRLCGPERLTLGHEEGTNLNGLGGGGAKVNGQQQEQMPHVVLVGQE